MYLIYFFVLLSACSFLENNEQINEFTLLDNGENFVFTFTSIPFPTPENGENYMDDKLNKLEILNKNCELPCWWGIEPGKTKWAQTQELIYPIIISEGDYQPRIIKNKNQLDETIYVFFINVSENIWPFQKYGVPYYQAYQISDQSQDITFMRTHIGLNDNNFSIPDILTEFGRPEDIFIGHWILSPHFYTYIEIYYPDYGIMFTYEAETFTAEDGSSNVCFNQGPQVDLWDPSTNISLVQLREFNKNLAILPPSRLNHLSIIESSIDLSVDEFYFRFKDYPENVCIII